MGSAEPGLKNTALTLGKNVSCVIPSSLELTVQLTIFLQQNHSINLPCKALILNWKDLPESVS